MGKEARTGVGEPMGNGEQALRWATDLAVALHRKHFATEAPGWKPLSDLVGVISQIDNMTTGLTRAAPQEDEQPRHVGGDDPTDEEIEDFLDGRMTPEGRVPMIATIREALSRWQARAALSSAAKVGGDERAKEAAMLAPILRGMMEGGSYDDPAELYSDDFEAPDGDVFVRRAADLLDEFARAALSADGGEKMSDELLELRRKIASAPRRQLESAPRIYTNWLCQDSVLDIIDAAIAAPQEKTR